MTADELNDPLEKPLAAMSLHTPEAAMADAQTAPLHRAKRASIDQVVKSWQQSIAIQTDLPRPGTGGSTTSSSSSSTSAAGNTGGISYAGWTPESAARRRMSSVISLEGSLVGRRDSGSSMTTADTSPRSRNSSVAAGLGTMPGAGWKEELISRCCAAYEREHAALPWGATERGLVEDVSRSLARIGRSAKLEWARLAQLGLPPPASPTCGRRASYIGSPLNNSPPLTPAPIAIAAAAAGKSTVAPSTPPERRPSAQPVVQNGGSSADDGALACAVELAQREFETALRRRLQQQQQTAVSTPPASASSMSPPSTAFSAFSAGSGESNSGAGGSGSAMDYDALDDMDLSIIAATTGRDISSLGAYNQPPAFGVPNTASAPGLASGSAIASAGEKRRPMSWLSERRAQVEWDFLVAKLVHDVYVKRLR